MSATLPERGEGRGVWAVHYAARKAPDTLCGRYILKVTSTNQWEDK